MEISYLGHSSFRIKTKNAILVTDPFESDKVGIKFSPIDADIVTVSHKHRGHNNSSSVKGAVKVIEGPGEYEVKDVSIMGFLTYHDKKEGKERGSNIIYVYEAEGLRLAHLGDLGHKLSEDLIEELGEIHVLMVPVGGNSSLDADEAAEVVRSIEPSIIIPMHYQEAGLNQENYNKLAPVDDFLKEIGVVSETLPKLMIKYAEIGEDSKVVVLERK